LDLYPFADHWVELDGHVIHYVDQGSGPTLLFLNGNPSWSFGWRDVIARLAPSFRCIAPDYPGFGLSVARAGFDHKPSSQSAVVERLVDHLGLADLTPVMYDWGGPIGLGLAGRRPELIRALVIGNTWAWPMKSLSTRLFSSLFGGPLGPLLVDRLNLILRVFLPLSLKRAKLTPAEKAAYDGPFPPGHRATMRVFPREIVAGRAAIRAVEAELPKLAGKPALLLWADGSVGLGADVLARWQGLFPGARTVPLVKVGRYLDEDAPDDIADAILAWWAEVPVPGGGTARDATETAER
jgi:haloalkane dehalogenase